MTVSREYEDLLYAALGPTPEEEPGPPDYELDYSEPSAFRPESWPSEHGGPLDGVFWFRWWASRLTQQGMTVEIAQQLRHSTRRDLLTGRLSAVAMHPFSGRSYPVPLEDWQATGDRARSLWWSGAHWAGAADGIPCNVYLIDPNFAPVAEPPPRPAAEARRANKDAMMIYGLSRLFLSDAVDGRGAAAELVRDLQMLGLDVSRDTFAERLTAGREFYDPARDMSRKS
jgi:hypothetical protein